MPRSHRFPTPTPITLDLRLHRGTVSVVATDTAETTVEITGRHADALRVEPSADGRRLSIAPVRHVIARHHLDVAVRLPVGSEVRIAAAAADISVEGPVSTASVTSASGRVRLEEVDGRADVSTASGTVQIGTVRGPLELQTASGSVEVERVTGACSIRSASGSIGIGAADTDVNAHAASGSIRVREAHRGTVDVHSTSGSVAVGVRQGTLVWLDVVSTCGRVHSDLSADDAAAADAGGAPLTVRARTVSGSVSVTSAGPTAIAL